MTNKEVLIKQVEYRSSHRGTKEMDLLLGNFVNKKINSLTILDLKDLSYLLSFDDDVIFDWYMNKSIKKNIPHTRVSKMLSNFKI